MSRTLQSSSRIGRSRKLGRAPSRRRLWDRGPRRSGVLSGLVVGLALSAWLTTGTAVAGVSFVTAHTYNVNPSPWSVAMGDLNGDGKPDLVTTSENAGGVSVLLGNGDGTFRSRVDYATGPDAIAVAIGDLNGDGKPDLVVADQLGPYVSVLLGNGDGTFQTPLDYTTGNLPFSVAIGDFNGDGKPDVAVANRGSNNVSVLLGNGDGTFQSHVDYPVNSGARGPFSVAIGDLNGDGIADLATANISTSTVSVLLGNGDGTFRTHVDYATDNNPFWVAIGDLNGDGKPDLVSSNADGSNTVSVLLGNGDGTLQPHVDYATGDNPLSVAIGDFNGDGKPDLVTGDQVGTKVSVLPGTGDGTFPTHVEYTADQNPVSVAVGDLNGDGKPDLAVSDSAASGVTVLLNEGAPVAQLTTALAFGHAPIGLHTGSQAVTLTNVGDAQMHIGAATLVGIDADEFAISGNGCSGRVLPAGQRCNLGVRFGPLATGAATGLLEIADDAATTPDVMLAGIGDPLAPPPVGPPGARRPAGTLRRQRHQRAQRSGRADRSSWRHGPGRSRRPGRTQPNRSDQRLQDQPDDDDLHDQLHVQGECYIEPSDCDRSDQRPPPDRRPWPHPAPPAHADLAASATGSLPPDAVHAARPRRTEVLDPNHGDRQLSKPSCRSRGKTAATCPVRAWRQPGSRSNLIEPTELEKCRLPGQKQSPPGDLNPQPLDYKSSALPIELGGRGGGQCRTRQRAAAADSSCFHHSIVSAIVCRIGISGCQPVVALSLSCEPRRSITSLARIRAGSTTCETSTEPTSSATSRT